MLAQPDWRKRDGYCTGMAAIMAAYGTVAASGPAQQFMVASHPWFELALLPELRRRVVDVLAADA